MTVEELHRLPWKLQWHVSGDICMSVYKTMIGFNPVVRQSQSERREDYTYRSLGTRYRFNGKTYRSHKSVVNAINELLARQTK